MRTETLDIAKYFIWVGDTPGREKITVGGDTGYHFTLMWSTEQKAINFHKTIEIENGRSEHVQLFRMKAFTVLRFLILFLRVSHFLIHKHWSVSKINLGKLKRYNLVLLPHNFTNEEKNVVMDEKRKKMLRFKKKIEVESVVRLYKSPDEIGQLGCNSYSVFSTRGKLRLEGILLMREDERKRKSFYFVTKKTFNKLMKEASIAMFEILRRLEFENKTEILDAFRQGLLEKYPAA